MFVTTPGTKPGDMSKALETAQQYYQKSGINVDLVPVTAKNGQPFQVNDLSHINPEGGNTLDTLRDKFNNGSGEIGALRKQYKADMVVAVGPEKPEGGVVGVADMDSNVAVVLGNDADTLAHELGHNFGMDHSHDDPNATDRDTIMAYGEHNERFSAKERNIANANLDERANEFENWERNHA